MDAAISLIRLDLLGAGLGLINVVPVLSDFTGAATLGFVFVPRMIKSLRKLGDAALPLLNKMKGLLEFILK